MTRRGDRQEFRDSLDDAEDDDDDPLSHDVPSWWRRPILHNDRRRNAAGADAGRMTSRPRLCLDLPQPVPAAFLRLSLAELLSRVTIRDDRTTGPQGRRASRPSVPRARRAAAG